MAYEYENEDVRLALGLSQQTLKKLRSLLVNEFKVLKRGEKFKDYEYNIVKFAVEYVQDNPGASYETGIRKAMALNVDVDSFVTQRELEELENYEALEKRFGKLWESYILMTTALSDLANDMGRKEVANLLNATVDITADILGADLKSQENS